jgi:hypothetical protein
MVADGMAWSVAATCASDLVGMMQVSRTASTEVGDWVVKCRAFVTHAFHNEEKTWPGKTCPKKVLSGKKWSYGPASVAGSARRGLAAELVIQNKSEMRSSPMAYPNFGPSNFE